ncbi:MAG: YigZ family protein [Treponemataceae bacterium]|nr:YigZ family protein [Treponemataceae bacterium]
MEMLERYISTELVVKKSRFLNELFPCREQDEARALIKAQKAKSADASHVVHAFALGPAAEILGMSDDGEPSGTAGRPMLDVLKGRGCTNLVLTVTRWFGGVLLGTGGLVKAYGDCAKSVLAAADAQGAFSKFIARTEFSFSADYAFYKAARHILAQFSVSALREEFGADVLVAGSVPADEHAALAARLREASGGRISI